jgi:hypothetical protein
MAIFSVFYNISQLNFAGNFTNFRMLYLETIFGICGPGVVAYMYF